MAKSSKKKVAKPAKKTVAKAKPASKAKKAPAAKAKVVAKKAAPAKKTVKKVAQKVVTKAAPAKKVAKKEVIIAPKKAVEKKIEKVVVEKIKLPKAPKETVKKVNEEPVRTDGRTQAHKPAAGPLKLSPSQLNIFPIISQRPIAHKPAHPSTMSEDKTRYTEDELKEFALLINGKLDKAREEFKILKDTLTRTNDAGTDSTSGGNTKVLEDGAETAEKENLSQLAARQLKYITNLENALVRIKNGTYGICSVTGKLISKERLIAVPHTTQSIEAKMMKQD
jgi:RNA polymerase-binding transcription factor DksA